jgi:hypothetical protein
MSFIKMLPRLADLKYFLLVLSLVLTIPFTPLETHAIYGGDYINRISIPYRKGPVKALSFLTGFTLLPINSSPYFPIISDAWSATYYVDATNGNDANSGLSPLTPWKTIAKVNASRFQSGNQILIKRGEGGSKVKPISFNLIAKNIVKDTGSALINLARFSWVGMQKK